MGLYTSHNCWTGAYGAFMRWRCAIANAAGMPPLTMMEGYLKIKGKFNKDDIDFIDSVIPLSSRYGNDAMGHAYTFIRQLSNYELPFKWDYYKDDPLTALLNHSDCDGELDHEICGPLADRLEEVLPNLPEGCGGGHIGNWRDKTQQFINGLRDAAKKQENVLFC